MSNSFVNKLSADYHNHPQAHRTDLPYSFDVLEPWALKAKELGLKDLAFTDHDRYKEGFSFTEIEELQQRHPEINFRAGIEIDNDPETSQSGFVWLKKNYDKLDFVLGSVHFVEGFAFDHPHYIKEYEKYDINHLYREYYKNLRSIAASGFIDSMAHLDLIKIFKFFPTEDMTEIYDETLSVIKENDLSIEISTAGLRKPIAEIYPAKEIVKMAQDKDISFTIASDAHSYKDLSHNYDKLADFLNEMNISKVAVYEKHKKTLINAFL